MPRSSRLVLLFCLATVPLAAGAADDTRFRFLSFAHLDVERFEGRSETSDIGTWRGRFDVGRDQFGFTTVVDVVKDKPFEHKPGTLANIILDAYVTYDLGNSQLVLGQTKVPVSMEFSVSSSRLDFARRGMERGLDLDRALGVMLRGRRHGAFGYDVGIFNIAGRSPATAHQSTQESKDYAWAGRLMYDRGRWHAELSVGTSQAAGGRRTRDYRVADLGVRYAHGPWTLKGEWIEGKDVRGIAGRDERVWLLHAGHRFNDTVELLLRHNDGRSTLDGTSSTLANTYLGANIRLTRHSPIEALLRLDYMFVGGDRDSYTGVRGFRSDAVFAQLQLLYKTGKK